MPARRLKAHRVEQLRPVSAASAADVLVASSAQRVRADLSRGEVRGHAAGTALEHGLARRCAARHGDRLDDALRPDHLGGAGLLPGAGAVRRRAGSAAPGSSGSILRGNFTGQGCRATIRTIANGASGGCSRAFITSPSRPCASRSNRSRRRNTCAGCCAGSMSLRSRKLTGERGLAGGGAPVAGLRDSGERVGEADPRARVNNYDPAALDQLCLTGAVGWGRLSPHPATLEDAGEGRRRVVPTSVAPITFFVREDADWMQPRSSASDEQTYEQHSERSGARGARISAPARRFVLRRHRARHRQAESRDRNRAVGIGRRRTWSPPTASRICAR